MVTCLAVMTNLECLAIAFESSLSRPDRKADVHRHRHAPSSPFLLILVQRGQRIFGGPRGPDRCPSARLTRITFFHQLIFETPQLVQFMGRTTRFQALVEAHVVFDWDMMGLHSSRISPTDMDRR